MLFAKSAYYSKKIVVGLVLFILACSGRGNVDLSKATKLTAEPVDAPKETPTQVNALFKNTPGEPVAMKASGILSNIDSTGTNLINDYDGDGIPNNLEQTTNKWVSDYPYVEASIAPPVTMQIQILKQDNTEREQILSQINSDDYEAVKNQGTEKVHQNEVNARSVMVQDEYASSSSSSGSSSTSSSMEADGGIELAVVEIGGGGSSSSSHSESWSNKTAYSATTTTFPTIPFKNNLDRDAISVKSNSAARNARKYRIDLRTKKQTTDKITPNAGTVRAALYIKNLSANMPVRISNILCTFMFESSSGQLIPIQSFRLRNDDYSLFSVNVYGGSEFGPYVVELNNLNTAEVERALQLGFNPKIFIVDYEMTHVPNSNYRNVLTGYYGDNLKIIEENAKGRTALIKIKGPGIREMYRVGAFNVTTESPAICPKVAGADAACPGITMRKALQRIRDAAVIRGNTYAATNIEYIDYIFDLGEKYPRMPTDQQKIYLRTVKTIGSISSNVPCDNISQNTSLPSNSAIEQGITGIPLCKSKPLSQWSQSEKDNFGVWAIFSNGRYYNNSEYERTGSGNNSQVKTFTYNTAAGTSCYSGCIANVTQGIDGTVWAGDNYDFVYLSLSQFLALKRQFGNNPLETGEPVKFNTKWDLGQASNVFDPEYHSRYLGQVALGRAKQGNTPAVAGDKVEITIQLDSTWFLNPIWNDPNWTGTGNINITEFNYNPTTPARKKFNLEEVIDFEVNLGVGAEKKDWGNVLGKIDNSGLLKPNNYGAINNGNGLKNCGKTLDYLKQEFKICVELPPDIAGAGSDGLVSLYLRPVLNNAYRNSVWPQDYRKVNKIVGKILSVNSNKVKIINAVGEISTIKLDRDLFVIKSEGVEYSYRLTALSPVSYGLELQTDAVMSSIHKIGDELYVPANEDQPTIVMTAEYANAQNSFYSVWTQGNPSRILLESNPEADCSEISWLFNCFGLQSSSGLDFIINNHLGNFAFENNWSDGSKIQRDDFLKKMDPFLQTSNSLGRKKISFNHMLKSGPVTTLATVEPPFYPSTGKTVFSNEYSVSFLTKEHSSSYPNGGECYFLLGKIDNKISSIGKLVVKAYSPFDYCYINDVAINENYALGLWYHSNASKWYLTLVDIKKKEILYTVPFSSSQANWRFDSIDMIRQLPDGRFFIHWYTSACLYCSYSQEYWGVIYDPIANQLGAEILLGASYVSYGSGPFTQSAVIGNRLIVTWTDIVSDGGGNPQSHFGGKILDITNPQNGQSIENSVTSNDYGTWDQRIVTLGNEFFILRAGKAADRGPGLIIQQYSSLSGSRVGSPIFVFDGNNSGFQNGGDLTVSADANSYDLLASGNRLYIFWATNKYRGQTFLGTDTYLRIWNLGIQGFESEPKIVTSIQDYISEPRLNKLRDKIVLSWRDSTNLKFSLLNENGEIYIAELAPDQPLTSYYGQASYVSFDYIHFVGLNQNYNSYISASFKLTSDYGLNNFFTSPLIENNYTITAKVLKE